MLLSGCGGGGGGDGKSGYYLPKTITFKDSDGNTTATLRYNRNRYGKLYWKIDDGFKKYEYKIKYNENNMPEEMRVYRGNIVEVYEKYIYSGNFITHILSNDNDSDNLEIANGIGSHTKYKYINNLVVLIEKDSDNDGTFESNTTIEYYRDHYGKVKKITDLVLGYSEEFKHNSSGNVVEKKSHSFVGDTKYTYSYNDKGSLIKEEIESRGTTKTTEYHLTYDENDNIIKRDVYKNGTFAFSQIITWDRYDSVPFYLKRDYFLPDNGDRDPLKYIFE